MASVLRGQSGQPIQFETKPNVDGDDVTTQPELDAVEFLTGSDRTWQDVSASRSNGVTYTNTTGREIAVCIRLPSVGSALLAEVSDDSGTTWVTVGQEVPIVDSLYHSLLLTLVYIG